MKTYKNLYTQLVSDENIKQAIIEASRGKRKCKDVQNYLNHIDTQIPKIRKYVENFHNLKHTPKTINDGLKARTIIVPAFKEQIVHHMIVQVLKPMLLKGTYEHTYGSIPKKGIHLAKKYIERWLRNDIKNTRYFLKLDIRQFFNSIPLDIMKEKLSRKIKDDAFLNVLFKVLDVQEKGLPLGFYTSQYLAVWYLEELDHFIKEELGAKYYVRYMDDMVIFGPNKRKLHKMRIAIDSFLATLGLKLKSNWTVRKFIYNGKGSDLDFMGFRFFRYKTILRKRLMLRICRLAREIKKSTKRRVHKAMAFMSYVGWINASDSYKLFTERIKTCLSLRHLKILIRRWSLKCGINQKIQVA